MRRIALGTRCGLALFLASAGFPTGAIGAAAFQNPDPYVHPWSGTCPEEVGNCGQSPDPQPEDDPQDPDDPDPIDLYSGAFRMKERDLGLPGIAGLDMTVDRFYSSGFSYNGPFGRNWDSPLFMRVCDLGHGTNALLNNGRLRTDIFPVTDSNPSAIRYDYVTPRGFFVTLEKVQESPGVWTFILTDAHRVVRIFEYSHAAPLYPSGNRYWYRLREIRDPNGNAISFVHAAIPPLLTLPRVVSATDTTGRAWSFEYLTSGVNAGRVRTVSDGAGATVTYDYDASGNLAGVTLPSTGAPTTGPTTQFSYDAQSRLTSITETSASGPYLANQYDGFGRVAEQQFGGPAQVSSIDYSQHPLVRVTPRAGSPVDYLMNGDHQIVALTERSGAQQFTTTYQYNADLLRTQETRPNGSVLLWSWNTASLDPRARGNLLSFEYRSSAQASTGLRKTWEYHPQFNKVTREKTPRMNALGAGADPSVQVTYDPAGNATMLRMPDVMAAGGTQYNETSFDYDSLGRLVCETDPRGVITAYGFDPGRPFYKSRLVDSGGIGCQTLYFYDAADNLILRTTASGCAGDGAETSFKYNLRRQLTEHSVRLDALRDRVTKFSYDTTGHLVLEEVADDSSAGDGWFRTAYTYDRLHYPTSVAEDLTSTTSALTVFHYDNGQRLQQIDLPEGISIACQFDGRDLRTSTTMLGDPATSADDRVFTHGYDSLGRIVQSTNSLGETTTFVYDQYGRVLDEAHPDGTTTKRTYDEDGNVLSEELQSSSQSILDQEVYAWDLQGRLVQVDRLAVDADGANIGDGYNTRKFDYDSAGNLSFVEMEDGTRHNATHDSLDRLVSIRDSLVPTNGWDLGYMPSGHLATLTRIDGNQLTGQSEARLVGEALSYDLSGNLLQAHDALGGARSLSWTLQGDIRTETDQNGNASQFEFDERGDLLRRRDLFAPATGLPHPEDRITDYTYDRNSQQITVTARNAPWGSDQLTTFAYNRFGEPISTTYPSGASLVLNRDLAGRVATLWDANGSQFDFIYDLSSALSVVNIERAVNVGGATFVNFVRDERGRVTEASNDESIISRRYNSLGGCDFEAFECPAGCHLRGTNVIRDIENRILQLHYPSHSLSTPDYLRFTYDGLGRVDSIQKVDSLGARTVADYSYAGPRVLQVTRDSGSTVLTYDAADRVTSLLHRTPSGGPLVENVLDYDGLDNPISVRRTYYNAAGAPLPMNKYTGGIHFEFNPFNELKSSASGLTAADLQAGNYANALIRTDYAYDRSWNRHSRTVTEGTSVAVEPYSVGPSNEYTTVGAGLPTYDGNGNLTSDVAGRSFVYDAFNRPVLIESASSTVSLFYDAFGRRLATSGATGDELLVYWNLHVIERRVSTPAGIKTDEYIHGRGIDDILGLRRQSPNVQYNLFSGLSGSPLVATAQGTPAEFYAYEDFGAKYGVSPTDGSLISGSSSGIGNPLSYQGRPEIDGATDLLDFRHRVYLPRWNRFAQADPLGYPDGLNRYHFGHSNPNNRDPFGLFEEGPDPYSLPPGGGLTEGSLGDDAFTHSGITMLAGQDELEPGDLGEVAAGNRNQDDPAYGRKAGPPPIGNGTSNNFSWHALGKKEEDQRRRMLWIFAGASRSCDKTVLGWAMHYLQDMHAHRTKKGKPYPRVAGHGVATFIAGVMESLGLGGIAPFNPDNPRDPKVRERARAARAETSLYLRMWADHCGPNIEDDSLEKYRGGIRRGATYSVGPETAGPADSPNGGKGVSPPGPKRPEPERPGPYTRGPGPLRDPGPGAAPGTGGPRVGPSTAGPSDGGVCDPGTARGPRPLSPVTPGPRGGPLPRTASPQAPNACSKCGTVH